MYSLVALLTCILLAKGDIYMHNPRGSNNRLDEARRERNNGNRLFDSQNNNRGGYNVGSLYYYQGSQLQVEWTNQHSCNSANNHCELILQYMCGDNVRDGVTTSTIPENPMSCENYDCNTDTRYGMHENYDSYLNCKLRQRNMGLFTADQRLRRNTARYTRQNPGGTRRGYECPEERDYYPYWHPSPWKDIAVMTNDATRCPFYQSESQNVKGRWACVVPFNIMQMHSVTVPNNQQDCENFRYPKNNPNGTRAEWKEIPAWGIPAPECRETEFSRDNHLGNGLEGYPNLYNWTIPSDINHERCVLRLRYNISTAEFKGWDEPANSSLNRNRRLGPESRLDLSEKYKFNDFNEAKQRGYVFKTNPEVKVFEGLDFTLRLAINTAQYGRVFQDRSHTFAVRPRPESLTGVQIHNVNVRGKRGNIVQVYPAVEYDFVPNTLQIARGEYIHYQWTGSNTNPHNNDGQGQAGTDRSNVVLQASQAYNEGSGVAYTPGQKNGHWGRSYPMHIKNSTFLGLSKEDLQNLALLGPGQFRGEMSELDDAGTYFDLGPRKVTSTGTYHYLCTRNNNFSNRSQKGRIVCTNAPSMLKSIGWNGGNFTIGGKVTVNVPQGTFQKLVKLHMEEWEPSIAERKIAEKGQEVTVGDSYASNFYVIKPEGQLSDNGGTVQVQMKVDDSSTSSVNIYRTNSHDFATWTKIPAQVENGIANFQVSEGGVYVARTDLEIGAIVGGIIAAIAVVLIIAGTAVYCRRHPEKYQAVCTRTRNIGRSVQSQI